MLTTSSSDPGDRDLQSLLIPPPKKPAGESELENRSGDRWCKKLDGGRVGIDMWREVQGRIGSVSVLWRLHDRLPSFSVVGGLSCSSSHPTVLSIPTRLFESSKFDIRNSPFSTDFDSETLATFSDSQERHSSTENLSGASPSCNSSLETCSYLQQLSPSLDCHQDSLLLRSDNIVHIEKRHKATEEASSQGIPPGNLKHLLIACARALCENKLDDFEKLIEKARSAVSISGEPIQRLGAYLVEGLAARKEASGTNIYQTLRCREPEGKDLLSYMHILYEICPYLKFGYMAANGAIAEACRTEDRVHIIDFQIAQGTQWMTLLQALAARPIGRRLKAISEKFKIPVEFHAVPVFAPDITKDMLDVRHGEALAVNFPLQLHHTPDESVDVNNPRDELLRMVKSLSPKVVTLVERESNINTAPFFPRFLETLEFYTAMFESIDVTLPRDRKESINVEQHCLARDIVNIIACEGKERVERHELFGKWKSRLTMAGFRQYPLSSYVNSVIRELTEVVLGALYTGGEGWGYTVGVEGQEPHLCICLAIRVGEHIKVIIRNDTVSSWQYRRSPKECEYDNNQPLYEFGDVQCYLRYLTAEICDDIAFSFHQTFHHCSFIDIFPVVIKL
ncbi:hypothetical protein F0562_010176 [Nyssa sinensis]|uniref:Uncharacterized protein n=1 Tax=Nyssa sinensis TaxID=561372 RepID=A0A5J4ZY41_9ASTE|nr:hypothetical protein F0562_010176 [Nyssa sinensis]